MTLTILTDEALTSGFFDWAPRKRRRALRPEWRVVRTGDGRVVVGMDGAGVI